jgi:hypothetical protein
MNWFMKKALQSKDVSVADFLAGNYEDPSKDVTYAGLRNGMAEAELSFNVNF